MSRHHRRRDQLGNRTRRLSTITYFGISLGAGIGVGIRINTDLDSTAPTTTSFPCPRTGIPLCYLIVGIVVGTVLLSNHLIGKIIADDGVGPTGILIGSLSGIRSLRTPIGGIDA